MRGCNDRVRRADSLRFFPYSGSSSSLKVIWVSRASLNFIYSRPLPPSFLSLTRVRALSLPVKGRAKMVGSIPLLPSSRRLSSFELLMSSGFAPTNFLVQEIDRLSYLTKIRCNFFLANHVMASAISETTSVNVHDDIIRPPNQLRSKRITSWGKLR